jgi:hypothetical protein
MTIGVIMRNSTKEKLMHAARKHAGIFSAADVVKEGLSIKTLYNLRDSNEVIAISCGLFQLVDMEDIEAATPDYAAI